MWWRVRNKNYLKKIAKSKIKKSLSWSTWVDDHVTYYIIMIIIIVGIVIIIAIIILIGRHWRMQRDAPDLWSELHLQQPARNLPLRVYGRLPVRRRWEDLCWYVPTCVCVHSCVSGRIEVCVCVCDTVWTVPRCIYRCSANCFTLIVSFVLF